MRFLADSRSKSVLSGNVEKGWRRSFCGRVYGWMSCTLYFFCLTKNLFLFFLMRHFYKGHLVVFEHLVQRSWSQGVFCPLVAKRPLFLEMLGEMLPDLFAGSHRARCAVDYRFFVCRKKG